MEKEIKFEDYTEENLKKNGDWQKKMFMLI